MVRCAADWVRPIALMQNRIKHSALRAHRDVAAVAAETTAPPQKGFVGRRIQERLLGFDEACARARLRAGRDSAGVLFHFAQACPSLVHGWLDRVLERMRLPGRLVHLIQVMYRQNTTVFEAPGSPVAEVKVASRVRHGCPLSGLMFALALDLLKRRPMAHRILATVRLFAYADDLAARGRRAAVVERTCIVFACLRAAGVGTAGDWFVGRPGRAGRVGAGAFGASAQPCGSHSAGSVSGARMHHMIRVPALRRKTTSMMGACPVLVVVMSAIG